jgi:hypothetical protein
MGDDHQVGILAFRHFFADLDVELIAGILLIGHDNDLCKNTKGRLKDALL